MSKRPHEKSVWTCLESETIQSQKSNAIKSYFLTGGWAVWRNPGMVLVGWMTWNAPWSHERVRVEKRHWADGRRAGWTPTPNSCRGRWTRRPLMVVDRPFGPSRTRGHSGKRVVWHTSSKRFVTRGLLVKGGRCDRYIFIYRVALTKGVGQRRKRPHAPVQKILLPIKIVVCFDKYVHNLDSAWGPQRLSLHAHLTKGQTVFLEAMCEARMRALRALKISIMGLKPRRKSFWKEQVIILFK